MPYLDHAATSLPKPPEVIAAMGAALAQAGNPSRGGHRHAASAEGMIAQARLRVARLLGAEDPRRIVFTLNGTDALNIAIHAVIGEARGDGARERPRPHVVTTALEHNSVTRPLETLRRGEAIDVTCVGANDDGVLDPRAVVDAIRPETALVAVTMASNALGTLQPVAQIVELMRAGAAERSVHGGGRARDGHREPLLLVDAAQVLGAIPVDLSALGADLVACPGHKALLGPTGTGVLYVGPRAMPSIDGDGARIGVFRSGGTGGDSRLTTMPPELPHRLEGGTPNVVGIAGLGAGTAWIAERGVETIRAHEQRLVQRAIDALAEIGGVRIIGSRDARLRAGAVSIVLAGFDPLDVGAILDSAYDVAVRPGLHCAPGAHRCVGTFPQGTVRMSVGVATSDDDVDNFVRAVGEIATG